VRTLARGFAAGVVGTAAMTAWQELSARLSGHGHGEGGGDGASPDPWDAAPAPAKVARKFATDVLHRDVSPARIPLLTTVMHWATGTGWGVGYALVQRALPGGPLRKGLAWGTTVWAASYAQLVPMGIYEPPWKYPPGVVGLDLSYHLVYGVGTSAGLAAILPRTR
jgi:hypothetical protein